MVAPHAHYWIDRTYEEGIVIETCRTCGAVHFGLSEWEARDVQHPAPAILPLIARAAYLNLTEGKEVHDMAVQPAKKVIELPPSFTPRPEVPDGAGPWKRNLIVGKWYDENRQAITELFHNEGYPGLEKAGISFATAKGLWKKWDLPAPGAPPAESAPARLHSAVDWPSYQDLLAVEASGEERLKWLELTHDLVAAGKLVLH